MKENGLIKHLELYLGAIDYGWSMPTSPSGVMVARFRNKPYQGAYSYVTLGMSNYQLPMSDRGQCYRNSFSLQMMFSRASLLPLFY
jgi:hypothetical protein